MKSFFFSIFLLSISSVQAFEEDCKTSGTSAWPVQTEDDVAYIWDWALRHCPENIVEDFDSEDAKITLFYEYGRRLEGHVATLRYDCVKMGDEEPWCEVEIIELKD